MYIYIGSDHAGYFLKQSIIENYLKKKGIPYKDFGCYEASKSVDYPEIAKEVCLQFICEAKNGAKIILICGTGIGMAISANKFKGIRAVCSENHYSIKYSRLHNDANALCLGGRVLAFEAAVYLVDLFLNCKFEGGRHKKRLKMIDEL